MIATTTQLLSSSEFFGLHYDTIPVKSASSNVTFCTSYSKIPNFELWHSCCKWVICERHSNAVPRLHPSTHTCKYTMHVRSHTCTYTTCMHTCTLTPTHAHMYTHVLPVLMFNTIYQMLLGCSVYLNSVVLLSPHRQLWQWCWMNS